MHQALRSLAVLPDDEQAYLYYHKVEAEKRLMSMSRREKDKEDVPVEITKLRPVPFSTRSMGVKNVAPAPAPSLSRAMGSHGLGHCTLTSASASISSSERRREASGDADADVDVDIRMEKSRDTLLRSADVPDNVNIDGLAASHSSNIPTEESPTQRVAEIRRMLLAIYAEFSPEKVPKIDRLLGKYAGREEEFLRFVNEKYSIDAPASALGVHTTAITGALPPVLSETRAATAHSSYFRNNEKEIVRREQSITSTDVSTCSSAHSKSRSSSRSSSSSPSHSPRVRHESYHDHEAEEDGSSSGNGNRKEIKSSLNYDAEADPGSAFDSLGDAEGGPRNMISAASRCAEPLPSSTATSTSTGLLHSLNNQLLPNAQNQRTVGHREVRDSNLTLCSLSLSLFLILVNHIKFSHLPSSFLSISITQQLQNFTTTSLRLLTFFDISIFTHRRVELQAASTRGRGRGPRGASPPGTFTQTCACLRHLHILNLLNLYDMNDS